MHYHKWLINAANKKLRKWQSLKQARPDKNLHISLLPLFYYSDRNLKKKMSVQTIVTKRREVFNYPNSDKENIKRVWRTDYFTVLYIIIFM